MGGSVALLGAILALTHPNPAQASVAHHPAPKSRQQKSPIRHVAVRHVAVRHVVEHHPAPRHVVIHHVVAHHPAPHHTAPHHVVEARRSEPARRVMPAGHLIRVSAHFTSHHAPYHPSHAVYARHYGGISCVPFARAASGIELKGNAANWWDAAAGVYERGDRPEPGSVLNFRATGRMRLGHVSVVSRVINAREVEVDHANWPGAATYGGVARGIPVIDVSPRNDWSMVRVGLGHGGEFGSEYPTYGFIYDRPDHGTMMAHAAPHHAAAAADEVAEAPASGKFIDAPAHSLR